MDALDRDKRLITLFVAEFSQWAGTSYAVVRWPDLEARDQKAIDAIASDEAGRELAIEHTLLQPFIGDRADSVPFLKTAGLLDQRKDLAEPNWMIDLVFDVGAIPKGVDWTAVGQRLEEWFIAVRPTLKSGGAMDEVDGLPFSLKVAIEKSSLPGTPGCLFVMRTMPKETVEPVLRTALGAKLPKLSATPANQRILLLEMESPTRGNWEIGQTIEDVRADFPDVKEISSIWLAKTTASETKGYIGFHLIWPLDQVERHQEWWKSRPNRRLHPKAAALESLCGRE